MTDSTEETSGAPPLFDVRALLATLWSRRFLIAAVAAIILAMAVAYVALTVPTYTADASILVDTRDSRATNFNSVLPGIGTDSAAIASQVSVVESRDLLSRVFKELKLAHDPEYNKKGLTSSIMALWRKPKPVSEEAIFEAFRKHVNVDREGLTYVIDVKVSSTDPAKAALIANTIVKDYQASLTGEKESANSTVTGFLTEKVAGLQKAVSDAERNVQDFKFQHKIYDTAAGGTLQSQIDQLTTQIGAAQDKADQAQDRYHQAVQAGDTPKGMIKLAGILSSPTADNLRQEYNQTAAALANAETIYGPRHPAIRSAQAQMQKIQGLMIQEADRITAQLKSERDLAVQNVKALQDKLKSLRDRANQSDLAQVKLRELQRKADAARAVLDDFLKRSQETSQLQGIQLSQVRVIGSAVAPVQPTWPKPKLLLPVALLLGLMAGCALALMFGPRKPRAAARGRELTPAPTPAVPAPIMAAREPQADPEPRAEPVRRRAVEFAGKIGSALADLGTYSLPIGEGLSVRSSIRAMRIELQNTGNSPLSLAALRLLRQILGRLTQHEEQFVLTLSAIERGSEHKLAAALIGIGLQQLEERVLLVEIADQAEEPEPLTSVSSRRGTAVFVDPSSRLPTVIVGSDREIDGVLARNENAYDFLIIVDRPLTAANYDAASQARSDLTIFALAADDREAGAEWLRRHFAGSDVSGKATVVIEEAASKPASGSFPPRLVASETPPRKPRSASEG